MSSPQQAPTPYQPANQPGADSAFQAGAGQLATAGSNLYGSTAPQLSQITSNIQNNPYYSQALQGAQAAAGTATNTVAPSQFAGAAADTALGAQAGAGGTAGYNAAMGLLPATTGGAAYAPNILASLSAGGVNTYNQDQTALQNLSTTGLQAGNAVLQTGFDPQNALYDRSFQQQQDQTNAANAMNGVAGSPFAAGLDTQANQNFNIDWQNNQLNRQIQALGAYDSAASTYAGNTEGLTSGSINNLATGVGAGVSGYNAMTSGAANNASTLIGAGTGALNAGTAAAVGANAGASDLNTAGLNTLAGAAQLPSDIFTQQQQAYLQSVLAQIGGTNTSMAGIQQATTDQGNYLNIGQTASQGAINATQANNQANAQASSGLGNLFGDVLGMFSFGL